jgi:hypothetical protein
MNPGGSCLLVAAVLAATPALAEEAPPPQAFHLDFGAGVGGCGGDACLGDDGSLGLELGGRFTAVAFLDFGARIVAMFGDVDLAVGSLEVRVDPLRGMDSPIHLYLAAGPGFGTGGVDFGGALVDWSGFAVAGRVGADFPTSYGAWGVAAGRVIAFGESGCTVDPGSYYGYYGDCDDLDTNEPPQFWLLGATLSIDP